jgi:hypothetical protein
VITVAAATVNRMANKISRIHLRRWGWDVWWRRSEAFSILRKKRLAAWLFQGTKGRATDGHSGWLAAATAVTSPA